VTANTKLYDDAQAIWSTSLEHVQPEHLLKSDLLRKQLREAIAPYDRVVIVGAGKAAAGMAAGLENLLGKHFLDTHHVSGLISVPEGCSRSLRTIDVRETRPAGQNVPTQNVIRVTHEMLETVSGLSPKDAVIALFTGGGSALLTAPRPEFSLQDIVSETLRLSQSGATISQLNASRTRMSLVKGGGLARTCRAGVLIALVLSDVIGNDLQVIASGPCISPTMQNGCWTTSSGCHVEHIVIGDNTTAVNAATLRAHQLGYNVMPFDIPTEADAEITGRFLSDAGREAVAAVKQTGQPHAIITGGESTVTVPSDHGLGGRNQQTVLKAIDQTLKTNPTWPTNLLIASIGTDGEDGPTDAAGAVASPSCVNTIQKNNLDITTSLNTCDAYSLFKQAGALIHTGPTGTNVADLRIVLAR
jgi:hydroxypyruvate reductase